MNIIIVEQLIEDSVAFTPQQLDDEIKLFKRVHPGGKIIAGYLNHKHSREVFIFSREEYIPKVYVIQGIPFQLNCDRASCLQGEMPFVPSEIIACPAPENKEKNMNLFITDIPEYCHFTREYAKGIITDHEKDGHGKVTKIELSAKHAVDAATFANTLIKRAPYILEYPVVYDQPSTRLITEIPYTEDKEKPDLHSTTDAQVWIKEWQKIISKHPGIPKDKDTMIGWFANAIMAGYDQGVKDTKAKQCVNCGRMNPTEFTPDEYEAQFKHSIKPEPPLNTSTKELQDEVCLPILNRKNIIEYFDHIEKNQDGAAMLVTVFNLAQFHLTDWLKETIYKTKPTDLPKEIKVSELMEQSLWLQHNLRRNNEVLEFIREVKRELLGLDRLVSDEPVY